MKNLHSMIIKILAIIILAVSLIYNFFIKNEVGDSQKTQSDNSADKSIQQNHSNQEGAASSADAASGGADAATAATAAKKPLSINPLLNQKSSDVVLGSDDAPITIIEYSSLSCPHCANFANNALPTLQKRYIDNGKVKFIHRDFPLNAPAMYGTLLLSCTKRDNYHNMTKILFKTQESWAFDKNFIEKLEGIAKLQGMSGEEFQSCINNRQFQDKILADRMEASEKLEIRSTPTFFINGRRTEGFHNLENLEEIIEEELELIKSNS